MTITREIGHDRHCTFNTHVRWVFVTKCRKKVFTKAVLEDMQNLFEKTCVKFEAERVEFDDEGDHVHLLVNYPPKVAVSRLVNSKGVSSRVLRKTPPKLVDKYYKGVLGPSYFVASCGGAPISIIRQYIEQQQTPD